MKTKIRLQFDWVEEEVDVLDAHVARTNASSRAEVIRRAFKLWEFLSHEATTTKVILRDEAGQERELVILL